MNRSEIIRSHYGEILETMVEKYTIVLKSKGRCQYDIYIWDDGKIECLQMAQGDHSYLIPRQGEKRDIHYVCTVSAPYFDPWDCAPGSKPDDDAQRERDEAEIIDWVVLVYRNEGAEAALDAAIENAELEERYEH